MGRNRDIDGFARDAGDLAKSLVGFFPGAGLVIGVHDTYKKSQRTARSGRKAWNTVKRNARTAARRKVRKTARAFGW